MVINITHGKSRLSACLHVQDVDAKKVKPHMTSPYKGEFLSVAFCQAPEFPAGVNFLDGEVIICFKFLPKQQGGFEYEDITETFGNLDHIVVCYEPYPYFWIKQMAE